MSALVDLVLGIVTSIGGFVEAGSISTAAQAGSEFGYQLLWAVAVATLMVAMLIEMSGRLAAVSKRPLAAAVRERFGIHFQIVPLAAEMVIDVLLLAAEIGGVAIAVKLVTGAGFVRWILPIGGAVWIVRRYAGNESYNEAPLGQADDALAKRLRDRKAAWSVELAVGRLAMDGRRIVHRRPDAGVGHRGSEAVAIGRLHDVEVIRVLAARGDRGRSQSAGGECLVVDCRELPSSRDARAELTELDGEDGCLDRIEPAVEPAQDVFETLPLAVVAEQAGAVGDLVRLGDDGSSVPERAEVLRRVEAERGRDAERAQRLAADRSAV